MEKIYHLKFQLINHHHHYRLIEKIQLFNYFQSINQLILFIAIKVVINDKNVVQKKKKKNEDSDWFKSKESIIVDQKTKTKK